MSKRGRPAKPGERYPSGELKRLPDPGTADLRGHRATLVGNDNVEDPRAGYPLGILNLRGLISDAELAAGLRYAKLHRLVFGSSSPRSPLAKVAAGATTRIGGPNEPAQVQRLIVAAEDPGRRRMKEELDRASAVLRGLDTRRPYDVLQNIGVHEQPMRFMDTSRARTPAAWRADQRDLDALRQATQALVRHWRLGHQGEKQAAD